MSLIIDEHRAYLADAPRISAFREALAAVVRPGDVVLDLGAGTGVLGLLACRAGAARVYAVDYGSIVGLAREIARANGFGDRVTFIKELSTRTTLPERVDVVVTDQIGRFGFEAGVLDYLSDARARMLKPGGRTIPAAIELWIAPVTAADAWEGVAFWDGRPAGFDFTPAAARARHTIYPATLHRDCLLADPQPFVSFDADAAPGALRGAVECAIGRSGLLHGIGGWFSATLAPGVTMTNSPVAADRIARRQAFLPIDRPVAVQAGDAVRLRIDIRPSDLVVTWRVAVTRPEASGPRLVASFRQSTFQGMLLPREQMERTRPDATPNLSAAGEARKLVLELCDGRRTLAEIEAEVQRRHPALLPSAAQAAAFVAEVVTRYAD